MLTGNHDSYFRDNCDVNSVSIFKGWNNITVIDKAETIKYSNKTLTFCPWGTNFQDLPKGIDILFGHLEINSFKKNVMKMCEDGISSDVLLEKADLVLSGHFHLRDERDYGGDKKIVYVGCPYPQSWSDANAVKGYYILDIANSKLEFTENTVSPRYHKISLSDFFVPNELPQIKKMIPNNFIKIIADKDLDYTKLEKLMSTLTLLKPLELSSDFVQEELAISENYESVHLDVNTMINEFVSQLDIKDIKDKVIKELEDIYNKAITKVNIETV